MPRFLPWPVWEAEWPQRNGRFGQADYRRPVPLADNHFVLTDAARIDYDPETDTWGSSGLQFVLAALDNQGQISQLGSWSTSYFAGGEEVAGGEVGAGDDVVVGVPVPLTPSKFAVPLLKMTFDHTTVDGAITHYHYQTQPYVVVVSWDGAATLTVGSALAVDDAGLDTFVESPVLAPVSATALIVQGLDYKRVDITDVTASIGDSIPLDGALERPLVPGVVVGGFAWYHASNVDNTNLVRITPSPLSKDVFPVEDLGVPDLFNEVAGVRLVAGTDRVIRVAHRRVVIELDQSHQIVTWTFDLDGTLVESVVTEITNDFPTKSFDATLPLVTGPHYLSPGGRQAVINASPSEAVAG